MMFSRSVIHTLKLVGRGVGFVPMHIILLTSLAGMTLCGPGYDAQVQTHEQMGLAGMTSQMPGDFFQPGGVPPTSSSASSRSWNPHTLLNPIKALAAAGSESPDRRGSKNKRGVQQSPKSPAEKRPSMRSSTSS